MSYEKEERIYAPEQRLEDLNVPDNIEVEFGISNAATIQHIASHIRDYLYCFLSGGDDLYRVGNTVVARRGKARLVITIAEVDDE